MEITLKIEKKGAQVGTIGWLAKNAAAIRLAPCLPMFTGDQRLGAWLIDHDGKTLAFLADSVGRRGSREEGFAHGWTSAAQSALMKLELVARDILLEEDESVTFTVTRT